MLSALAAVPALLRADLFRTDITVWVVAILSGLLAAFVVDSDDAAGDGVVTARELVACVAAFVIVSTVVVAAIVAQGTSLRALFEGLLVWPLRFPAIFSRPLPVPTLAAVLAPVWLVLAVCRRRNFTLARRWMPSIALAFGMILFLLSITKNFGLLLALGAATCLVGVGRRFLERRRASGTAHSGFHRDSDGASGLPDARHTDGDWHRPLRPHRAHCPGRRSAAAASESPSGDDTAIRRSSCGIRGALRRCCNRHRGPGSACCTQQPFRS